jgi:hypothetical protein
MGQLKLYGMRTAYDEIIGTALKRQHEPQQIINCPAGDLQSKSAGRGRPAERRDQRETGAVDQIPDDHRQAAAGQGT